MTDPAGRAASLLAGAAFLAACANPPERLATPSISSPLEARSLPEIRHAAADAHIARELTPLLAEALAKVEGFFGASFPAAFEVMLLESRGSFDATFPPEWGLDRTQCWMVATGVADGVRMLSPRVWGSEACEHDAEDEGHVLRLLTHELVHVYHGQHNPSPDFVDEIDIDWFVEGLATLASGQLEAEHRGVALEVLREGRGPTSLSKAWTGPDRYGVAGSLVAWVDQAIGRRAFIELLAASSGEELLEVIGENEEGLLEKWGTWALAP